MHYTFQLSTEEKALIVQALRERAGEAGGPEREELARRIDYTRGEEDGLEAASRTMRAWYHARVRDLAEDILRAILDGEVSDLGEYLDETVDGTDLVIYTWKASAVLFASDNEDAAEQEFGEAPDTVEGRAYWALRADVLEALESMVTYGPPEGIVLPEGFELHDADTWTGTTDEDADEATETAQADEVGPDEPHRWEIRWADGGVGFFATEAEALEGAERAKRHGERFQGPKRVRLPEVKP